MKMDATFFPGIERKIRNLYNESEERAFFNRKKSNYLWDKFMKKDICDSRDNDFGVLEDFAVHGDDQCQAPSTAEWRRQVIDEAWYK